MKTQVLAVRLPEEQTETLQKMADSRGLKVSDLVKDMITEALSDAKSGSGSNADVMARLEQLEASLTSSQKQMGAILIAALGNTAGARYLGNLCAIYADDIISYLATSKPLDDRTKAQRDEKRQADEDAYANECIKQALEGSS
jgi:hypothetical protein